MSERAVGGRGPGNRKDGRWLARALATAVMLAAWSVVEAADPPTLDQFKPKQAGAVIKAVSLSANNRSTFDSKRVGTRFPDGVTHMIVWYRWEGAPPGHRMDIHWYLEGSKIHEDGESITKAAGTEAWVLKTMGSPLPAGSYRVELLENRKVVAAIPFSIGGKAGDVVILEQYKPKVAGAVIRAVSLSASDTDDFDSKRVGTEFPEGVSRVVVYYLWEGARSGHRVDGRWLKDRSVVGEKSQTLSAAAGFGVFSVGPLSKGAYRVELLENGKVVTTIPFRIGKP